jgi:aminomethyltransferase
MKKTIFYDTHVALGAQMRPFGGYLMPIRYEGIIKEHVATRSGAALFDTCHMGEFRFEGPTACQDLESILSCDVGSLKIGRCKYGFICNPEGGVIDDQLIYRLGEHSFYMVVNASTRENDFAWIRDHLSISTTAADLSEETAKIDIQGPSSAKIVQRLMDRPIGNMAYYSWMYNGHMGKDLLLSRTGYTGEIGFEVFCDEESARSIWSKAMELGARPVGLGARDTLRLEMGFPLYGHELDTSHNAAESGFSRAIAQDKRFIGSEFVQSPRKSTWLLSGILLDDRRAARGGDRISDLHGSEIGTVTSGSFAPSVERAIAMGYIHKDYNRIGETVVIFADRHELTGKITELPFYKKATARSPLADFL